tara:strand:+ start:388 stop:867 length:480 start_codon:yes stop_codon:yes gene_type:complete
MRILLTIILSFSINIFGDDHMSQKEMNLKVVNTFWDNILTENYQVALDTLHEDLEFEFMGICSICKKYNRETYESEWFMGVIPSVLPNGIEITKVNQMADDEWVVTTFNGKAMAANGEYNNRYAMVMKLKDNQIIFFQEYQSDLLAETALFKKEVVDIK